MSQNKYCFEFFEDTTFIYFCLEDDEKTVDRIQYSVDRIKRKDYKIERLKGLQN